MKLSSLKLNEKAVIKKINLNGELLNRLNALGVTNGAIVKVKAFSYFFNPLMIEIRNYSLAIRKEIADRIEVEK